MDDLKELLRDVVGVVEATSYEQLALWKEWHKEQGKSWVQGRSGLLVTVGHYHKRPVCISIFTETVDGHRILFMEPTSQLVCHKMIEKWLKENLPETAWEDRGHGKYVRKVDAMNFHNVFPRG